MPRRQGRATCASVLTQPLYRAGSWRPPQSNDGGSPAISRGGNSKSTPRDGPKCVRMMLARSRDSGVHPTASPRIRRASSSIDRPLPAARTHKRVVTSASRLRIVMLARISHQAACQCQKALGFHGVDHDVDDRTDCGLRWPRPRGSFRPVRARAPSTVVPATLSVASTRTGPKSSAIISAPGEKCGLATVMPFRLRPSPNVHNDCDAIKDPSGAEPRPTSGTEPAGVGPRP